MLATLLHYANADAPFLHRTEFYALKTRLLERYGTKTAIETQEIRKKCWGWRDEYGGDKGCRGDDCTKCGGTGVYSLRWVKLERWQWCGYVFHRPIGYQFNPPDPTTVKIFGRIEHADYGRASQEAALWLYLLCGEWRLLWKSLRSSCACGWYWWPMLNLQRVTMELSMFLSWRKCFCGRRFPTWGSGWQMCRKCRRPVSIEEIPF